MDARFMVIFAFCVAAVLISGCTGSPAWAPAPVPASPTPGVTTVAPDARGCTSDADCVPAQCCHPTGCTSKAEAPSCDTAICTMSCEGPLDCGAGRCGCVNGTCGIIPAVQPVSVTIEASPQRYSPVMSSTPGIGLAPSVTGFIAADAGLKGNGTDVEWDAITCEWNATYGKFLTWDAPDYRIHDIGDPVATGCRKVYWTFTEKPESVKDPVIITVTARDMTRRGAVLGSSTVSLAWDGDYTVYRA